MTIAPRLLLLFAALTGLGLFLSRHAPLSETEGRYQTAVVKRGDLIQTVTANGVINPVGLVNVGTQVSGTVKRLHVDFNSRVKEGDLLLELDDALLAAQVRQSAASLENARSSLELALANEKRQKALFEQEFISRQEMDQALQARKSAAAQVALAKAQHEKDRVNHAYTAIRAPVDGVVVDRVVDVGQTVAASFQTPTLFKIARDLSHMQINASFAEADIGQIREGLPARFSVDAFPNRSFEGQVRQVRLNATMVQNVVTYDVVIGVDNPDLSLLPGMTAMVNLVVAKRPDVLLLPNTALRYRPKEAESKPATESRPRKREGPLSPVHLLEQGKPKRVECRLGLTDNRFTELLSGEVSEGAVIITGENRDEGDAARGKPHMRLF
ncbi:MAG: efflux RND transporter periplasmic adaptor subunit [Magnetococcales bacterium]|nr:efflux RND transporter periplasmic adaptor subunit [Magnetococcales bacterium]